jgi:hypothetical protein
MDCTVKAPNKKQRSKIASQKLALRASLWPTLDEDKLWDWSRSDGWLNIPRATPILLRIMDNLSKGKPVSSTYLDLWCRTFGDSFVIANKHREMAFFSGFTGERAERTWVSRMRILERLGFIEIQSGPNGAISYILILNPYLAVKRQHASGMVDGSSWNALIEKMIEIRANDLQDAAKKEEEVEEALAAAEAEGTVSA